MSADFAKRKPRRARLIGRPRLIQVHRWLSIAAAAFWLIQATTGVLLVFHWELDDVSLSAPHRPTDLDAIDRRLDMLAPPGSSRHVVSIWTSAGLPDRYDVTVADDADGSYSVVRINGDGSVLRTRADGERGVLDTLVLIHQTLLSGDTGSWIVGTSGLLLLSNLALGLTAAWPRNGAWRRAMTPVRRGAPAARTYSLHRAIGLWAVVPAMVLVSAGTALVFEAGTASLIGAEAVTLPPRPAPGAALVPVSAAVRAAERAIPGSSLTAVTMPTAADATYQLRLLAPDEFRRAYGTSIVFVDGVSGRVRHAFPARAAPWPRAVMDGLYAVHTGEMGGLAGRLLVMAIGCWLATMVGTGLLLWSRRRRMRKRA